MYTCTECGYVGIEQMGSHCPNCDAKESKLVYGYKKVFAGKPRKETKACLMCGAPADKDNVCSPCYNAEKNV